MSRVKDILGVKGTHVLSIGPSATVLDAAVLMNEHKVGALIVISDAQVLGIITERDILQKVVAQRRDSGQTLVREAMTTEVICCVLDTPIDEARSVMKNRRIRHLPVLNERREVCGLVSIGDLNAYETNSQELTIHVLEQYIYGRA
jgi:CBS domain-containing protein